MVWGSGRRGPDTRHPAYPLLPVPATPLHSLGIIPPPAHFCYLAQPPPTQLPHPLYLNLPRLICTDTPTDAEVALPCGHLPYPPPHLYTHLTYTPSMPCWLANATFPNTPIVTPCRPFHTYTVDVHLSIQPLLDVTCAIE